MYKFVLNLTCWSKINVTPIMKLKPTNEVKFFFLDSSMAAEPFAYNFLFSL